MPSSLSLLNVGHGNCAIVQSSAGVAIIDIPRRGGVLQKIGELGTAYICMLIVSHADADHMDNAATVLLDDRWVVGHVYVNPDSRKESDAWDRFRTALVVARRKRGTQVHSSLNSTDPGALTLGEVILEILAPTPEMVISGPGSTLGTDRLDSNTLSAVVRVWCKGVARAVLPGDFDAVALRIISEEGRDWSAETLVYPHHGGRSGGDDKVFAEALCTLVAPSTVVFSNGFGRFDNPRSEVLEAIMERKVRPYIACIQLNRKCIKGKDGATTTCAGMITIDLSSGDWISPSKSSHQDFIRTNVRSPMCRPNK